VEDFFAQLDLFQAISLATLAAGLLFQLVYYLVIFARVPAYKPVADFEKIKKEPVSIIICARNEAENLKNNLPNILEQNYPDFEVIVVNDCSDDDTQDILEEFQEKYTNLKLTQIKHDEKFTHGKKLALTIGIKAAKNEWLLLTDADCQPNGSQWLSTMQQNFTSNCEIVLGYGGFNESKGFLNKLVRFDTFFIALQYIGFALIKLPYMGVGRNLAYRKSLFMKNKGFASHAHILSGDDDLFVNEVANSKNTKVEFAFEAHTRSIPKKVFNSWAFQKRRHLSSGQTYKFKHKFLLGLEVFSRMIFYIGLILTLVTPVTWIVGLSAYLFRLIIQLIIFNQAMNKLNEKNLLLFSIIFDLILPLTILYLYTTNFLNTKQRKWK